MSLEELTRKMSKYYEKHDLDIEYKPNQVKSPTFKQSSFPALPELKVTVPALPNKSGQSNNTPSVKVPGGSLPNALDAAKQVIAKQTPVKQVGIGFNKPTPIPENPFKKVPQTLPYNPAAVKKATDKGFVNGVIARSKTPEELRQYNLQNIKRVGDEMAYDTTKKLQDFFEKPVQPKSVLGANAWAGLGQFNKSLAQTADFILPDVITPVFVQQGIDSYKRTADAQAQHAANVNAEKGVSDFAGQMMQGTVAALPNAILAMLSGGTSLGAQTVGQTSTGLVGSVGTAMKELAKNPMFYSSLMQTAGSEYEQAKANGATELEATLTAIIGSIVNAGIEIGGGIEAVAKNPISLKNWVKGMLDEGKEEVLQGIISQAAAKATYDNDKAWVSATDENAVINPGRMAQEFAGGAVVGGVLGGGQMLAGKAFGMPTEQDSYLPQRGENATAAELAGRLDINDPFAREEPNSAKIQEKIEENNREFGLIDSVTMWSDENYRNDPDREKAKNGDEQAAKRLVDKLVTPEFAEKVKQKYPDAVIVPVVDFERTANSNVLPAVFASKLSDMTGLTATLKIGKMNTTDRAHAKNALERLMQRAEFSGEVIPGKQYYLMADDFVSTGFTLADLKRYIESKGGKVVGAVTLAATNEESLRLTPTVEELERLNGYDRTVLEDILRSYQITDNIENLSRAEIQKIAAVLGKGEKGGYKGNELYNRLRTALDAAQRSGNERIVSKRQNNLLNETTAENGGFSMPKNATQPALPYNPNAPKPLPQNPAQGKFGGNTVGAAQPNPGTYANLQTEHGVVEPGENPARMIDMPKKDANGQVNSLFARTVAESEHMPDEMVEEWENAVARGDFSHSVATDKAAISSAERKLSQGWDKAMNSWQEVVNGEKVATKNDIALGELLLANAMKDGDTATAMQLTAELCAEATRAGQAVQAMRLLKKMTPQGQLYYLQKMVNNLNEDFRGRRNFNGITIDKGLADNLVKATTREEMDAAVQAIRKNVAEQTPVSWQDRWNAWRYLSMLGNPTTHIRNFFGNALFAPVVSTKNRVAQVIESAFKNTPYLPYATKAVVNGNTAEGRALLDFAATDYDNVAPEIQGAGKYSEKDQVLSERQVLPGIIGKAAEANSNLLDAEDMLFSKSRYRNSLASYLKANNITVEQAKADPKVLEQARRYAIKEAQKATYRDASYLASILNRAKRNLANTANNTQNKMGKRLGARAVEVGLEGLMPFTKTPINILKRGVEYSPAGLAKSLTYDLYQVKQGNMTAAEAIDGIAAGLTGSALVALGWFMSSMGWVTGGPDEDDRRDRYESMLGRQDYALTIDGKTYTIDWLAPEALPYFVGVALQESRGDDATFLERFLGTISTIAEPMIEMSMLEGVNSSLEAVKYSEGFPLGDFLGNLATSYAGQGIPTVFGKVARSIDPTSRQTYYDPNKTGVVKAADVFRQKAQAKSPWEGSLQPRVDLWGREEQNTGGNFVGRLAYNMLSPGYLESDKTTEVDKELLKLAEATGETKVFPDAADKTFEIKGEKVKLTAEEYTQYAKDKGQKSYEIFDSIIGTRTWSSLSNDERVEVSSKVYEYANALAKSNVSDYELQDTAAKFKACEDAGIPAGVAIVAYCAQKDVKGDKNSNGKTVQLSASKNKKKAIDDATPFLNQNQRILLYDLFGVSEKVR